MDPVEKAFVEAARDRARGAAAIERRLLGRLLTLDVATPAAYRRGARALRDGQPVMANLVSLAARAASDEPAAFRTWAAARLETLRGLDERLARAAWPTVRDAAMLVSVSRSSAVAAVIRGAAANGWSGRVVVLDGAPSGRGRDQARSLARTGLDVLSQPDAAALRWLEPCSVVVVGADAVGPRSFVNSVGTRLLLEAAGRRARPRLLVADRGKDLEAVDLERLRRTSPMAGVEGSGRRWPVFEEVPLALVDVRVDEHGHRSFADGAGRDVE